MQMILKKPTETAYNPYMDMPFEELMGTVFTPDGELKPCPRTASRALISRLERHYMAEEFGSMISGKVSILDAYIAGTLILRHGSFA